jgi:hypothetical protein
MRAVQVSQFSDSTIPFQRAASLCGPAAALAFARVNGRNPTLREAESLAKEVGWTEQGGMNGFQNEVALLTKLRDRGDVGDFEQAPTADQARITSDVQAGKPVIVSTGLHYFTLSDYDPQTGKFYVGTSGTDLKNGADWMSLSDIEHASTSRGYGGINGAIHLTSAPVSAERQRFLEANAPGESSVPEPKPTVTKTEIGVGDVPATGAMPSTGTATTTPKGETPEEKAVRDYLTNLKTYEAFNKRFQSAIEGVDTTMPAYKLPGLPTIDLGWRRQRFALPGAA